MMTAHLNIPTAMKPGIEKREKHHSMIVEQTGYWGFNARRQPVNAGINLIGRDTVWSEDFLPR